MTDQHTTSVPMVRVRIKHGRTMREGWAMQETTVEISDDYNNWEDILPLMQRLMQQAHGTGILEAARRNMEEGIQ